VKRFATRNLYQACCVKQAVFFLPGLRSVADGKGMEWSGVGEGKGERKWEGGEVGSYYGRREGGGWEDGLGARMWGSGLSGVFRKEGRGCGGGLSIEGRGRLGVEETLINSKVPRSFHLKYTMNLNNPFVAPKHNQVPRVSHANKQLFVQRTPSFRHSILEH